MVNYLFFFFNDTATTEIYTREELIELFDIKDVASSGAVFDHAKLEWLSHQCIKRMDAEELAASVAPFFPAVGLDAPRDRAYVARGLPTLKERGKTFRELLEVGRFYFERPRDYAREAADTYFPEAGGGGPGGRRRRAGAGPGLPPPPAR